jgi:hypothetical protein
MRQVLALLLGIGMLTLVTATSYPDDQDPTVRAVMG